MKKILTYCFFVCLAISVKAQLLPVRDLHLIREIQKSSISAEGKTHSSFNDYYFTDYKDLISTNSQYEDMFTLIGKDTTKNSRLFIMPVYQLMYGQDFTQDKNLHYLKGGLLIDYAYKDKFAVSFLPKQMNYFLPRYFYSRLYFPHVFNGEGFMNVSSLGYSTFVLDGSISYRPFEFLSLELAHGKNKFGDGYRSFFLSENSPNYQYLKLETEFLDIKYSCVWANLYNVHDYSFLFDSFLNNYAVFHYLDWSISKRFNLGFFESIVIKGDNPFSFEYMNPIIFFRPVEFNLGSEDNALLGVNARFSINNTNAIYGQFMIDDIIVGQLFNDVKHSINPDYVGEYGWFANKWAAQIGYKAYDMFKVNGLDFFTEVNIARPYIYSHANPTQSYSHFHQSLAHPLGANFVESVSGVSYFGNKFKVDCKLMYAKVGMDTANTHYGQNIFQPTMDGNQGYSYIVESYGNTILQGNKTDILTAKLDIAYFPFNSHHLAINVGILFRNVSPQVGERETLNYVFVGIKSNIFDKEFGY